MMAGSGPVSAPPMRASADYEGLSRPAYLRNNRTFAAAKVESLAQGGMEDFEIPAFLRKQAD
jgi:cell division protein FtsZ